MKKLLLLTLFCSSQLFSQIDYLDAKISNLYPEKYEGVDLLDLARVRQDIIMNYKADIKNTVFEKREKRDPNFPITKIHEWTYLKIDGFRYLISEKIRVEKDNEQYPFNYLEVKKYKYTDQGKRFLKSIERFKPTRDGSGFYISDGIEEIFVATGYGRNISKCRRRIAISNYEIINEWDKKNICIGSSQFGSKDINEFDLRAMINVFLVDFKNHIKSKGNFSVEGQLESMIDGSGLTIDAIFETIDKEVLGVSYGINDTSNIILRINPEKWKNSSSLKRWYTIYHELGHDVLRLRHGEGGEMMFNYSITDENYSWEKFFEQRDYMFDYFLMHIKKL